MLDLYDELRKVITVLEEKHIEYALCGGLAMAIYNHPRATVDIDLLIASESLDTLIKNVAALGYEVREFDISFSKGAIEIRRVSKIDRVGGQVLSLDTSNSARVGLSRYGGLGARNSFSCFHTRINRLEEAST